MIRINESCITLRGSATYSLYYKENYMSNCNDINGFTRRSCRCRDCYRRNRNNEEQDRDGTASRDCDCRDCDSRDNEAFGSVFSSREREMTVQWPCQIVPIIFDHNAMLKNMAHNPGGTELKTCRRGNYKVDFVIYLYSENSSPCSFIMEADRKAMSGGVFTSTLSGGHQVCSGSTMVRLGHRDDIRLLFTAPSAMQITVANATLNAVKMN